MPADGRWDLSIYLSGLVTAVAVFRNPNTIPFCLTTDRGFVFGFLAFFCFLVMSEELARCINPQPGGPGNFWSRFSSSSP
jgi:hypothetical protein